MDGWMDGWMEGWMDGGRDGWREGWMEGWMEAAHLALPLPHLEKAAHPLSCSEGWRGRGGRAIDRERTGDPEHCLLKLCCCTIIVGVMGARTPLAWHSREQTVRAQWG